MKLRVLFLSAILSFGLFFSSLSVNQANASFFDDLFTTIREWETALTPESGEEVVEPNIIDTTGTQFKSNQVNLLHAVSKGEESAINGAGDALSSLFKHSPASGETYVADLLQNMKIGPAEPAYAQVGGLGFAALEPVLYAWKAFRNIAYLFFIIITLIIGFMIMMRQKIGSQAAVTAQQAIPQIVIALITVTFSYAIAGFMIDMMYVFMFLLIGLFPDQTGTNPISKNLIQIGYEMFTNGIGTAFDAVQTFVAEQVDSEVVGFMTGLTFSIIIAIAYLFAVIQLFFELLKTYIAIVVSIVLSPLLLMMGALPGRSDVFGGWVKSLVGNLIAYPVVLLLVILQKLLTEGSAAQGGFLPPFLMARGESGGIIALMGLSIMLIAKDLVVQAKKSVNPKGGGIFEQFGTALSSAVSKGWKGGELIPGVGLTDTNKIPGVGKYMGSGKSILQSGLTGLSAGAGGLVGAGRGIKRMAIDSDTRKQAGQSIIRGVRGGGRFTADVIGSEAFKTNRSERQKTSVLTDRSKIKTLQSKEGK
ncbi:MAG: hypothetical protein OEX81_03200 [Candidatus Pacebacteria bacterium]|nr:hypothetical protein [Candidatus Paceibacterota bacterium]